jgi:transposase
MPEVLTMSVRERQYLQVIGRIKHGDVTVSQAAEILGLSDRQMYRLLLRYRSQGDRGLIHRLRGRSSNRGYPEEVQQEVLRLYREAYGDYGPTLFSEMLQEHYHRTIDANTLRRWLKKAGLWMGLRALRRHRKKRQRRPAIGDLLQFDGSFHDWFEGRGAACCLLVAIDDASGRLFMRFAESENTHDVLATLWAYVEQYGIPRQFYSDCGSVYYTKGERQTDVARALKRLGVEMIYAHSPQAKGRVERSNRTHQDRLIKALRREKISTIAEANRFLQTSYLRRHNARFASSDHLRDLHRPADGLDLKNIFCFQTTRSVYNDYTITLDAKFIQLQRSAAPLPPPRNAVIVRRWLDGSVHIFWHEQELAWAPLSHQPDPKPRPPYHPPASHPWHRSDLGDMRHKVRSRKSILASMKKSPVLPP